MERREGKQPDIENRLTPGERDLQKLFYLSFRYSQGDVHLQHDLLSEIKRLGYIDPSLVIQELPPDYIYSLTIPKQHDLVGEDARKASLELEWDGIKKIGNKSEKIVEEESLEIHILSKMIQRDRMYQLSQRRGRTGVMAGSDSNGDPHASFLRKYALHGANSGHPAYDEIFKALQTMMIDIKTHHAAANTLDILYPGMSDYLSELEKLWEENHSGEKFWDISEV